MENTMKSEYKKIAENNTVIANKFLGEFLNDAWVIAQTCTRVIQKCLLIEDIANDTKKTYLLLMLRNCISDLCCCLDCLDRGHGRTIMNNLRMVFEDFCAVVHFSGDEKVYQIFLTSGHQASKSIGAAKKLRPHDTKFENLYGELSKISHHVDAHIITRQMVNREGVLSHLKTIDSNKLRLQVNPLLLIVDFLRSIGEFAEEICLGFLTNPYFWILPATRNLSTKEDELIQKLLQMAIPLYKN